MNTQSGCTVLLQQTTCPHVVIQDEAKIRQDLVINVKGKCNELIGWIDTGEEARCLTVFREKLCYRCFATYIPRKYWIQISNGSFSSFSYQSLRTRRGVKTTVVLNEDMVNLMKQHQDSLHYRVILRGTIDRLANLSTFVRIFR